MAENTISRRAVVALGFIAVLLFLTPRLGADTVDRVTGQTTGNPVTVSHGPCPEPVDHYCVDTIDAIQWLAGPSQNAITALGRDFKDWTVTYNYTHPFNGTINITTYAARDYHDGIDLHEGCIPTEYILPDGTKVVIGGMGATLKASYVPDPLKPDSIHRFVWVQIIDTNVPLGGTTSPYVDPRPNDDTYPFYWRVADEGAAGRLDFSDSPSRECPCLGNVTWHAELYLADWYEKPMGATTDTYLILYDGIRWGFEINCVVPLPPAAWSAAAMLGVMLGAGIMRRVRRQGVER